MSTTVPLLTSQSDFEPDYDEMVEAREAEETWGHHLQQAETGDLPEGAS